MYYDNHYPSSNRRWINILGLASIVIIIFNNYFTNNDLKESFLISILDFDASLTTYIDNTLATSESLIFPLIIIAAHLYIYIYLFFIFQWYVFPQKGIFMNFIVASLSIMLLHVIKFTFFDNNPFTFAAMKSMLPYSGLWHLLTNFGALTGETEVGKSITENVTNTSDINLDLT